MVYPKYFVPEEFHCSCCGRGKVVQELVYILTAVRVKFDKPVTITSGYRCPAHNREVGGKRWSQHLLGYAADIQVEDVDPEIVYNFLNELFPNSLGLGKYETFTHVDVRPRKARW